MTRMMPRVLAGAFALATAAPVAAQQPAPSPSSSSRSASPADSAADSTRARRLETVTVTAVRGTGTALTTQSAVGREEIRRTFAGEDMARVLERSPAITSYSESGAYNNYSYIRVRGIDQSRINFTLDGIPLNEPEDQGLYFSNFPDFASSIASTTIQRGVGTSSTGTASYGGSVAFASLPLSGSTRGGEAQAEVGSFDTRRVSLQGLTGEHGGFAAYGRGSVLKTAGYRENSGNESISGFGSAGWLGARDIVKATLLAGRSRTRQAWEAASEGDLAQDRRFNPLATGDDFSQGFASLSHTRDLGGNASIATTVYGSASAGWYDYDWDGTTYNSRLNSRWVGGLSTWGWRGSGAAVDVGAHASRYSRDHFAFARPVMDQALYDNTGVKGDASAFAKGRVDAWALSLFGDVQLRRASFAYEPDAAANMSRQSVDWTFVNPKVGASWQAAPALSVYASYGSTGREPGRSDILAGSDNITADDFAALGGTLDRVKPERVNDLELGTRWAGRSAWMGANLFDMRFRDQIAAIGPLSPTTGAPLRKNVQGSWRQGAELEAGWQAAPWLFVGGDAAAMRARIGAYTDDASGETFRDVSPLMTPSFTSNHTVQVVPALAARISVDGRYVSRMFMTNTGDDRFTIPASYRLDLTGEYTVLGTALTAQVRNVLDAANYGGGYVSGDTRYYYVMAPRSFFLTARVPF